MFSLLAIHTEGRKALVTPEPRQQGDNETSAKQRRLGCARASETVAANLAPAMRSAYHRELRYALGGV